MKHDALLHKWFNDELTDVELEEFKKRQEFKQLQKIKESTDRIEEIEFENELVLNKILSDKEKKNATPKVRRRFLSSIAAAAMLLVLAGVLVNRFSNTSIAVSNSDTSGELTGDFPDESNYILYAQSKIQYDTDSWLTRRDVKLEGKAKFSVKPGKAFQVNTSMGQVLVLGTTFEVSAYNQVFEVSCDEGKVSVKTQEQKSYTLIAGEQLIQSENKMKVSKINQEKLEGFTLREVAEEIEKVYDVKIEFSTNELEERVNTSFVTDDLDKALKTGLGSFGLKHQVLNEKLIKVTDK